MVFTEKQIDRYIRQIILQDIGVEGQYKMMSSSVLVIGAGGLGSPVLLYLAAAGIGRLGIIDSDVLDLSNLQRQVLYSSSDLGRYKAGLAAAAVNRLNPEIKTDIHQTRLTDENAENLLSSYDFIVDATDNFETKFLINDISVKLKKPYSHAGVLRMSGQSFTYVPGKACLRCLFKGPPAPDAVPSCSQAGVLGAATGLIGTIQTAETLKYIIKKGDLLINRLLSVDVSTMEFRTVKFRKDRSCSVCGKKT